MDKSVPFIDLSRFENGFLERILPRVEKLICHTQFVGGKECDEIELKLKKFCEVPHALGCANGTDALQVALRAMGVGAGDRVLVPDSNFWAAFEAIVNVGAKPVTLDISAETLHVDLSLLEEALDQVKPRAVIMVHLYGWASPETDLVREACAKRSVPLLEDCAQSIGTRFKNKSLIGTSQVSTTSFYPAKVLGASGDAGAIFCQDPGVAERVQSLRNHGRREHYLYSHVGWNSRLGSYEAAFLNAAIEHLGERISSRVQAVNSYRERLIKTPLEFRNPGPNVEENGYLSVLLCESEAQRAGLIEHLKRNHIGFGIVYPVPLSQQPAAAPHLDRIYDRGVSADVGKRILSLPCFAHIRDSEIDRVCDVVRSYF